MKIVNAKYARAAFTLIEVVITTAIVGVIFAGFYAGIGSGFAMISLSRENIRANQILLDKMETVRLYSWNQICSNGYLPSTFTSPFYPPMDGQTNESAGVTYYGTLTITNAPLSVNYSTNLKLVTVSVTWTNANIERTRSMETMVSEFGMQTYVY